VSRRDWKDCDGIPGVLMLIADVELMNNVVKMNGTMLITIEDFI